MTLVEVERRLNALEQAVAELKKRDGFDRRWWVNDAGRFANDPIFEEIVRRGKAYRESQRPRQRAKSRSS
jgi:hypothetical protein